MCPDEGNAVHACLRQLFAAEESLVARTYKVRQSADVEYGTVAERCIASLFQLRKIKRCQSRAAVKGGIADARRNERKRSERAAAAEHARTDLGKTLQACGKRDNGKIGLPRKRVSAKRTAAFGKGDAFERAFPVCRKHAVAQRSDDTEFDFRQERAVRKGAVAQGGNIRTGKVERAQCRVHERLCADRFGFAPNCTDETPEL